MVDKFPSEKKLVNNKDIIIKKDIELNRGYVLAYLLSIFVFIIPVLLYYFRSM